MSDTITREGHWLKDGNGNRASLRLWPESEARAALVSLDGCTGCTNCRDCVDCHDCTACVGATGLTQAIDVGGGVTATVALRARFATQAEARRAMLAWINTTLAPYLSGMAASEPLAWTAKERVARAFLAGETEDFTMLEVEAGITGETLEALAEAIVARADLCTRLIGAATGLRRKTSAAIDATADPKDWELILKAAQDEAQELLAEITGATS